MLQYRWELVIPDPPAVVLPYALNFSMRVRSTVIPGVEIKSVKSNFGSYEFNIPVGKTYSHQFPVRFEEGYRYSVLPALYEWADAVFSEDGAVGDDVENLLAAIWLRPIQPDPNVADSAYHFYGVFPSKRQDSGVNYDSPSQVFPDVVFMYDYWRLETWPF
jgi:hypothetical protein